MKKEQTYFVYILANKKHGTLYTGITNDLVRRVFEHKEKIIKGFTEKYGVDKLVYFETHKYVNDAIKRESNIKAWKRDWKIKLIEKENSEWRDLIYDLIDEKEIEKYKEMAREISKNEL